MRGDRPSAAVVGAGIFGASIADALASRDWSVTLVEQAAPAHPRAASGDTSRVYRCGHGDDLDDAWHTRSARAARDGWLALEQDAGETLLVPSGVAWFDRGGDPWVARAEALLREAGVPAVRLNPAAAADLFPSLETADLASVLFEPEAGTLKARAAVRALVGRACARGARLVVARAIPRSGRAVLDDGTALAADRTIWACGPWLGGLFPEAAPVRSTRQDLFWWGAPAGWDAEHVPAWVDIATLAYGIGDVDGGGVKAVVEEIGEVFDPHAGDRASSARIETLTRDALAARFPALAAAPVVARRVLPYESTPDRRFILGPLPTDDSVWLAGGGSGHGFKHGPAIGVLVADWLEGRGVPDPRFAPGPRAGGPPAGALGPAG